ncbi:unnamed protein product, partial [Amoebophrya sp. A120]|eukprot:GSA120T00006356001.1
MVFLFSRRFDAAARTTLIGLAFLGGQQLLLSVAGFYSSSGRTIPQQSAHGAGDIGPPRAARAATKYNQVLLQDGLHTSTRGGNREVRSEKSSSGSTSSSSSLSSSMNLFSMKASVKDWWTSMQHSLIPPVPSLEDQDKKICDQFVGCYKVPE